LIASSFSPSGGEGYQPERSQQITENKHMKIPPFLLTHCGCAPTVPHLKKFSAIRDAVRGYAVGALLVLGYSTTTSVAEEFPIAFSASQSLFQGGPSAGFDYSGSFGNGSVGINYRAVANSGTVAATVNGTLQTGHPTTVPPNTSATVSLQFVAIPNGGQITSTLGANVNVAAYFRFSIDMPWPVPDIGVNESMNLLNEGFFVNPSRSFTPWSNSASTASDEDNAFGVGPGINLGVGSLSAQVNVDVVQTISFTPTTITGTLLHSNQITGATGTIPFTNSIGAGPAVLSTPPLGVGIWSFRIVNLTLRNSFNNNVDLMLRPTIGYIIGSWNPVEQSIDVFNETYALNFNTIQIMDVFSVMVPCPAPVFAGCAVNPVGKFQLAGTGTPGLTYTLQTSTNLVDWVNHTNIVCAPDGLLSCLEDRKTNAPAFFYRLKWP
jgi:hypothetical protein